MTPPRMEPSKQPTDAEIKRLRELKVAVDHPQGFETRLRNLGLIDIQTMTDVEIVNRELLNLIGGTN